MIYIIYYQYVIDIHKLLSAVYEYVLGYDAIMDFKEAAKTVIAVLLAALREGDFWKIDRQYAHQALDLAASRPDEEVLSMRLRSLVAEVADRRGWWSDVEAKALTNLEAIRARFDERGAIVLPHMPEWHWFRQAGWLLLQDVRRVHRSDGRGKMAAERHRLAAEEALKLARKLQSHLRDVLPEERNHEVLYRVAFSIARHCQALERYEEAETELSIALHHCCCHRDETAQRLLLLEKSDEDYQVKMARLKAKQSFTLFNTTVVVANIGRIDVQRGKLNESIPQLMIARTLLLDSKDIVMRGFVDLQLGSVYRQLGAPTFAKADGTSMPDPKELLDSAVEKFRTAQHRQLEARAKLELAQHLYGLATHAGNPEESRAWLNAAKGRLAEGSREAAAATIPGPGRRVERWDAERQLLLARIERVEQEIDDGRAGGLAEVTKHTMEALHKSDEAGQKDVQVVARLVLAELCTDASRFDEALRYCEEAEQLDPRDKADQAWLFILSAYAWLKQGDRAAADSYLKRWKSIEKEAENVHIRKKAEKIERKMQQMEPCYYVRSDQDLNYKKRVQELKDFLVQSVEPTGTLDQQAQRLGLKRQSLANLRNKMIRRKKLKGAATAGK
ncbi:MAG: hypothetical protein WBE38_04485 [Terracidiphilus sp.]